MITYYDLGPTKQLNEIVIAGSHDAAISTDNADRNTKTQDVDVFRQASYGARFFDLRVAAFSTPTGGAELKSYHADPILQKNREKTKDVRDVGRKETIEHTHLHGGAAGLGLTGMMHDAKLFVSAFPTEFLIFKFDKSSNWPLIAETCIRALGDKIFTCAAETGNLNTKTQEDLKGKVIVLFTNDGWANCGLQRDQRSTSGILRWRNLYKKDQAQAGDYEERFDGLQYYGKGGVSAKASGDGDKIDTNADVQTDLMSGRGKFKIKHKLSKNEKGTHGFQHPQAMGIMYWTTTGFLYKSSIEARNTKMWSDTNKTRLQAVWTGGYRENLERMAIAHSANVLPDNYDITAYSSGTALKAFMPNIVMVDFVDASQCEFIRNLNYEGASALVAKSRAMAGAG